MIVNTNFSFLFSERKERPNPTPIGDLIKKAVFVKEKVTNFAPCPYFLLKL